MATSIDLTSGADVVLPSNDDQTVNATFRTLNPADQLDGGGGFDRLILSGGGTYDLLSLTKFAGFDAIALANGSEAARIRLKDSTPVTVGGAALAGSTGAVTVELATGADNRVTAGDEDDTFIASASLDRHDVLSAGGGTNTLVLDAGSEHNGLVLISVLEATLGGITDLVVRGSEFTSVSVEISDAQFNSVRLGVPIVRTTFVTPDATFHTGSYYTLSGPPVSYTTENANGTTFNLGFVPLAHGPGVQPISIVGGPGIDTIVTSNVVPFNLRESLLLDQIDFVTDPSGTYQKLVTLSTPSETVAGHTANLSGTVDKSAIGFVDIYEGNYVVGSTPVGMGGQWSASVTLTQTGAHQLYARAVDGAGDVGQTQSITVTVTDPPSAAPVYRFFDTATGHHFYTASAVEKTQIQATLPSFVFEGDPWSTPAKGIGTVDVFRFFDTVTGDHFYTASPIERDDIVAHIPTYRLEGVAFEAYAGTDQPGALALERFFDTATGLHHYAGNAVETATIRAGLAGPGWVDEGVGLIVHTPVDTLL